MEPTKPSLDRSLSLVQATALNVIDMVGIGPFVTISLIASSLQGWSSLFAWMFGALLAFCDGMVWSELGSAYPEAGGSYVFLQRLFPGKPGRLMSFLFVWQTSFQAPLVMASAAIGFADYFSYLYPVTPQQQHLLSGASIVLIAAVLYRRIGSVGKISVLFSIITLGTILWIIFAGFSHKASIPFSGFGTSGFEFRDLATAAQKSVYAYLGYYNVCHLGAEIKKPEKNIPRAIFTSITIIAALYLLMQSALLRHLPWQELSSASAPVSLFFQKLVSPAAAKVVTVLILCIALFSLFSVMLGYSRIPYAAARDGNFFPVFSKLHPRLHIPHISLLAMAALAFVFSLLFKMSAVIATMLAMRILVQFVAQGIGLLSWHRKSSSGRVFTMPAFPLPVYLSIALWLLLFAYTGKYMLPALGMISVGAVVYYFKERGKTEAKRIE